MSEDAIRNMAKGMCDCRGTLSDGWFGCVAAVAARESRQPRWSSGHQDLALPRISTATGGLVGIELDLEASPEYGVQCKDIYHLNRV